MLTPGRYDLPAFRDDDIVLPFRVWGRDSQGNKTTVNLTGYTLESKFTDSAGVQRTATATFTDATTGSAQVFVARTVTTVLPLGNGIWYLALINPSNQKRTIIQGKLLVKDRGAS